MPWPLSLLTVARGAMVRSGSRVCMRGPMKRRLVFFGLSTVTRASKAAEHHRRSSHPPHYWSQPGRYYRFDREVHRAARVVAALLCWNMPHHLRRSQTPFHVAHDSCPDNILRHLTLSFQRLSLRSTSESIVAVVPVPSTRKQPP